MLAADVVALYRDLEAEGVPLWLMGGWGVDALLGRETRPHHDVDLLVDATGLERLRTRLQALGFSFAYVWDEECRWIRDDAGTAGADQPTAFVYADADGREVDVHVVRRDEAGGVETLWNSPYDFTAEGLGGEGVIAGCSVRCLSFAMQRRAHTGYELPPHHEADVRLLAAAEGRY
jgi:lincosamide nucleotidyltransferase A/C/D/E